MRRNVRLLLIVFVLLILLTPAFPVLAGNGGQETLAVGGSGERVAELQQLLKKAGFFPTGQRATGYFGWITYNSVVNFERAYGLKTDGRVGDAEWNILYGRSSRMVLGYYTVDYPGDKLSFNSLSNYGHLINHVAMFDFCVDGKGNLKGEASSEGIGLARKKGARTLMVVHNISAGTFDRRAAQSAISVKEHRNNLINNIVSRMDKYGYDGVNIDIEGLPRHLREDFNAFIEQLSSQMKSRSKMLTLAVPAKTGDAGNSWSGAYDYKTIGRLADYVVIMTYDEHWMEGPPGPVASLPWVTRVMDYAAGAMPPHKVLLGIACYGYDWPAGRKGRAVKWKDVPNLVKIHGQNSVKWDNTNSVPYIKYSRNNINHQVWFENRYSMAIKLNLVEKYGLGGIAFWRMGFEDASFWETLEKKMALRS